MRNRPAIIILDSMSGSGPRKSAVGKLKDWLVLEAKTKRGFDVKPGDFKGNFPKVRPQPPRFPASF